MALFRCASISRIGSGDSLSQWGIVSVLKVFLNFFKSLVPISVSPVTPVSPASLVSLVSSVSLASPVRSVLKVFNCYWSHPFLAWSHVLKHMGTLLLPNGNIDIILHRLVEWVPEIKNWARDWKAGVHQPLIWSSGCLPWGTFPGLNGQARIYTGGHSRIYRGSPLVDLKAFYKSYLICFSLHK